MSQRIKKFYSKIEQSGLDGFIVYLPANISYLTEYSSRDSYLLVSQKQNIYFTDSRYVEEAKIKLKRQAAIEIINGSCFKAIARACLNLRLKRIGFEERHLAYAEYQKIKEHLNKKAELAPTHSIIEELRQTKDAEELKKIEEAVKITAKALKFASEFIASGKKELEIAAELERFIRYHGATNSAFNIIVASGPNSSFPHHITSERKLRDNEPVLIDIGVDYLGYKSDLTRVFFLGKIDVLLRKIYNIVLEAQLLAIKGIKPGARISLIDRLARQHITQKGCGGYFGHSLGHGVGLEVHEDPHISAKEDSLLEPGMVFTVEPAVYLPKKFGIRIEDMVLVTDKGCEVLSGFIHK